MKIIVCLDERNGMAFCGKRQSMDRCLREHLIGMVKNNRLWLNDYSAGQFSDSPMNICVDEDFLNKAEERDFCFVENIDLTPYIDKIHGLIIYRWGRIYPSDLSFPLEKVIIGKKLSQTEVFAGYSHKQILLEVYE